MSDPQPDSQSTAAAIVHIQQLAIRYAVKVDQRDIPGLADVFVDDIECGHWGTGREALIRMYTENDATMGVSIHRVTNHLVDLIDADHATGIVYLIAEHQQHDSTWARLAGAYHDDYEKRDGKWLIRRRKLLFWYRDSDAVPADGKRDTSYRVFKKWPTLPEAWPSWTRFWTENEASAAAHTSVTRA